MKYIATRDGVEFTNTGKENLPATFNQKKLIENLLKDFPDVEDTFEYEDYMENPARGNAKAFITAAVESNIADIGNRKNYVEYIANRPRAEKLGTHGLFTSGNEPIALSQIADEAAKHPGNLWLPVISLRREDAERLGYDNASRWQDLLRSQENSLAEYLKIPPQHFRWYAAFHNEGYHPHVHLVVWSNEATEGFLTKEGIRRLKSALAARIFKDDLLHIYERQTEYRNELSEHTRERMKELITLMKNGELNNSEIEGLILQLSERLKKRKGKKQYGYLPAGDKAIVNAIADELCKDARVAECYKFWCEAKQQIAKTYTQNPPPVGSLSKQPELKRIRNIVIDEALYYSEIEMLSEESEDSVNLYSGSFAEHSQPIDFFTIPSEQRHKYDSKNENSTIGNSQTRFTAATKLLHHLGKIFEDNPPIHAHSSSADRKLLRKLRDKKIAQGHAEDDYVQTQDLQTGG